jgi:serine/threonine protein kinase
LDLVSFRAATETQNLGRYHVVKRLAKGGMADVLLARTLGVAGFERHVVIKRIHPELGDEPRYRKMFLDEARLAASLHHHNIVQVNDIGEQGGEYFFAMEYVHGEDARTLLIEANKRSQLIPLEHVITIVMAAASGLHHAHDQRGSDKRPLHIVHRDVSPANILVGYDGGVKVADFGIAHAANRAEQTQSGVLKGKASYMSPEQCNCDRVDRRSDVFSLGIVLYELSTVHPCFTGDNDFMTMSAIVNGRFEKPSVLNAAISAELEAIILKALSHDPDERYATCDELRLALEQFADAQNLRTSTTALADYMKQQFGTRPEPWLEEATPDEAEIEITGSSPLDLVLELKLPDPEPEDDLAVPIEETVQPRGMVPLATPPGMTPLATPPGMTPLTTPPGMTPLTAAQHRPVKSTLPLRALKLVPAASPAPQPMTTAKPITRTKTRRGLMPLAKPAEFPLDEEAEVSRLSVVVDTMRTIRIKRAWLVGSALLLALALGAFILVHVTGSSAPATPAVSPHEDVEPQFVVKQHAAPPVAAPPVAAPPVAAPPVAAPPVAAPPVAAPRVITPPVTAPKPAPAKKASSKKWDPDALFPK